MRECSHYLFFDIFVLYTKAGLLIVITQSRFPDFFFHSVMDLRVDVEKKRSDISMALMELVEKVTL